jgi:heme oxygenase
MFYTQNEARFNGLSHLKFHAEAPVLTWLQQDLAALGDHSPGDTPHSPGDHPDAYAPADFSQYVGYLYVKQGSTLGGQVLCRHLQTNIGLSPNNGLRFFYGFGEHTRQHWLDVLRYFEDRKAEVNISTAVTSACNHFRQLQILFENRAETVAT